MINNGLFSSIFIEILKIKVKLDDPAQGRMATLAQTWRTRDVQDAGSLWETFLKKAISYLEFVPPPRPEAPGVYPLFEDWDYKKCLAVLYLIEPEADIDDTSVGRYYPAKLLAQLRKRNLNWGILTDGARWRLYSTKSSRPYEDYVELPLADALESNDEAEYGLFERFFHKASFIPQDQKEDKKIEGDEASGVYKCRLDLDKDNSEKILGEWVKTPLLYQVDEILQYLCNGFIQDTPRKGEEYTEEERAEIFESAVKLLYRCLFLFYAESRRLLPSDSEKLETYERHSIKALCREARKFRWGKRRDHDQYDLWKHLKGLVNAVNDGDPEYGIMGYNGGLFDDAEEKFLGTHQLRNDFLSRALYLLSYVEPYDNDPCKEYPIPYEDLEVRHLGELYENILEYTVLLADADRVRRRTKKGVEILLASQTQRKTADTFIPKGDVFFGESALERKQTGSYYTPESLVHFLNEKTVAQPLKEKFAKEFRPRFKEFLDQASNGHDPDTRRGAAQAAAALVERFVEEEVLNFKVCDPAMGSGHFLVDASNQMAGLVVALLEEIPNVEGLRASVTSKPNDWRRQITRHCLYGVDLNPLAVNLAKLSLWLNCFAVDHKLTFLDHHLRQGNSLIGIRSLDQLREIPERKSDGRNRLKDMPVFNFGELSDALSEVAREMESITEIDEDDTDSQKAAFDEAHEAALNILCPLADLYTAYLMDSSISSEDYRRLFGELAQGKSSDSFVFSYLKEIWESVEAYKNSHHYYHWPLEFPDVFGPEASDGFSATVGNPPWDVVKPSSLEFFSVYDPKFREYKKQKANHIVNKMIENNPAIRERWKNYWNGFEEQRMFFREESCFSSQGKGDINTFKLFLEQFFCLLRNDGRMGILVPSSIYTDQGCMPLRKLFLKQSRIDFLYCFENRWPTVFSAVDGRFKFVTFGTQKGGETNWFKCAFMEHDPGRLPAIDARALEMKATIVKMFAPDSLGLIEFNSQKEIEIASLLYDNKPQLGNYLRQHLNTGFQREFHMTGDSNLFITDPEMTSEELIPLWEGKYFWILSDSFGETKNWMTLINTKRKPTTQTTRVVYRALAASTNERTFISTVIPKYLPTGHTVNVCPLPPKEAVIIASVMSSFVWDWLVRGKVTTSVSIFIIDPLPFLDITSKNEKTYAISASILSRGSRLICTSQIYLGIWNECFSNQGILPQSWINGLGDIDYGPAHEQEIRRELQEKARNLTPEWGPHCGVHDRLPDRRDTGDRAQLRAEIDAYVAHLFGLNREDFAYILDTFPVLKKKEEKAFGEFISKRKCLEEYDRIALIL